MALLIVLLVAAAGMVAGCVNSSEEAAQTPTDAPTVANSAIQTDEDGNFITAPAEEPPPPPGGGETDGGGEPAGDVAAGQQVFAANCTACHVNDGQDAGGVGPQLAGAGLDAGAIETVVVNGRGIMPAGLVSGEDLDDVVAYVLSLQ